MAPTTQAQAPGTRSLSIAGSWFQRRNIHRWTWYFNDGHTVKEIDHVITRQLDRGIIKSCRVFRGAEAPVSTDHRPLVVSVCLQMPYTHKPRPSSGRIDVDRLPQIILWHTHTLLTSRAGSALSAPLILTMLRRCGRSSPVLSQQQLDQSSARDVISSSHGCQRIHSTY
jgi:hypothetical protein